MAIPKVTKKDVLEAIDIVRRSDHIFPFFEQ